MAAVLEEQIALGRSWIETWRAAGADLEAIRRRELRTLDAFAAIRRLCRQADYRQPPRAVTEVVLAAEVQALCVLSDCPDNVGPSRAPRRRGYHDTAVPRLRRMLDG